ncbi:MAG: spermidine/putrescine ABC transporter permease [Treponema sp. CETP13]|nr:MAG: spermidine/putrescine ABC transporter permease [Treponema sp. CETP13]
MPSNTNAIRINAIRGAKYAWPMGVWFTVFFVAPLLIIFLYSFLTKGLYGGVDFKFSLKAYKLMFQSSYGIIGLRTLFIAVVTTVITILVALPCGYAMAKSSHQTLLLGMVIIPFWTNSLIRIFAWMSVLGTEGLINSFLMKIGITHDYLHLLYNKQAVILVSVYMYLPYAILPIFTSIDRFDFSLLEAARDLGATKPQSMFRVLLPSIKSGITTAFLFTFIPVFGIYTVPLLVGGKDSYMLGNVIVDQVNKTRNWPLASAFSVLITLVSAFCVLWIVNSGKTSKKRGGK